MSSYNKVILLGNVTREPDIRFTPKGACIADVGLAINRQYTTEGGEKREEVTFVDLTFFNRMAEIVQEYVHKGDPLFVEGRLQLDQWEDKQTGDKKSRMKVVGQVLQLLGQRREGKDTGAPPKRDSRANSGPARGPSGGYHDRELPRKPAPREPDDIPY